MRLIEAIRRARHGEVWWSPDYRGDWRCHRRDGG